MSLIQIRHLTFRYDGGTEDIFQDVNLQLDSSWRLGLLGRNGRGKTTFLHLLEGKYEHGGTIIAPVCFSYFPYEIEAPGQKTQTVVDTLLPDGAAWRMEKELRQLGTSPAVLERPFETLSKGEQTKVLLAALFLRESAFLLIDEPTNHLDLAGRQQVREYLRRKNGYILVSHDRAFLDGCVDHILSINRANLELQKGNYSTWLQNKAMQDRFELEQDEKLKKEIRRLQDAAGRTAAWSDRVEKTKLRTRNSGLRPDRGYIGHQAAKMMQRSKSIEQRRRNAVEEKAKLLHNLEQADPLKIKPLRYHSQQILTLKELEVCYDGTGIFRPLNLTVLQGERIAVTGENGAGKSSLLKLLAGERIPSHGTIQKGNGLRISYVPQDTSHLAGMLRIYAQRQQIDLTLLTTILRKLGFSRAQLENRLESMSHGQKKKILLAGSLCESAHLYLWDEPLNYIDLDSRIQLEQALQCFAPTMLFVEHDEMFCRTVATRTIRLEHPEE